MDTCSFCGREVKPTMHRREGTRPWEVDYYRQLTGDVAKISINNPRDEAEIFEFHKLTEPRFVIACADCIKKPEVEKELVQMFSGVPEAKPEQEIK